MYDIDGTKLIALWKTMLPKSICKFKIDDRPSLKELQLKKEYTKINVCMLGFNFVVWYASSRSVIYPYKKNYNIKDKILRLMCLG